MTDLRLTERAGDEERLAHQAMDDGVHTLVVCGGDGTWGKVAGAVVGGSSPGADLPTGASAAPPLRLAFLSAGTGNDFAKNLRAPTSDPAAMARMISEGALERLVDMGRVDDRLFLNVAGFGFDVAVLRSSDGGRWLRGPALYVATAVQELFSFEGIECRVCPDASDLLAPWTRRLLMVFANGAHFGGAFRVAPDAVVDDGALDAIIVGDTARWRRAPLLGRVLHGTHLANAHVQHAKGERFTVAFREPPWFEADGDLYRAAMPECEVHVIPGALRVLDAPQ